MNKLRLLRLGFEVKTLTTSYLPEYLGNTIRGALGNSLISLYCSQKEKANCNNCNSTETCIYANVFKSLYKDDEFTSVPNPYIIEVSEINKKQYNAGESFYFTIILFGRATQYIEEIISGVEHMVVRELGKNSNSFILSKVFEEYTNRLIYEANTLFHLPKPVTWTDNGADKIASVTKLEIQFITPVQILQKSQLIKNIEFNIFIDSLLSRVAAIIDLYEEDEFVIPYRLICRKPWIKANVNLRERVIKQERGMIKGMVGNVNFTGEITRYMPYIDVGQQLHVGKLTTRGFGQYRFTF